MPDPGPAAAAVVPCPETACPPGPCPTFVRAIVCLLQLPSSGKVFAEQRARGAGHPGPRSVHPLVLGAEVPGCRPHPSGEHLLRWQLDGGERGGLVPTRGMNTCCLNSRHGSPDGLDSVWSGDLGEQGAGPRPGHVDTSHRPLSARRGPGQHRREGLSPRGTQRQARSGGPCRLPLP